MSRATRGYLSRVLREVGRKLFAPDAQAPRQARALVRDLLERHGVAGAAADAALVMSELATNIVVHAPSRFMVTVSVDRAFARVEVHDSSSAMPVLSVPGERSNGRGLRIVDAIAARWGARPIPDDGKVVWFEVVE